MSKRMPQVSPTFEMLTEDAVLTLIRNVWPQRQMVRCLPLNQLGHKAEHRAVAKRFEVAEGPFPRQGHR